jgi:hypothetical protein
MITSRRKRPDALVAWLSRERRSPPFALVGLSDAHPSSMMGGKCRLLADSGHARALGGPNDEACPAAQQHGVQLTWVAGATSFSRTCPRNSWGCLRGLS